MILHTFCVVVSPSNAHFQIQIFPSKRPRNFIIKIESRFISADTQSFVWSPTLSIRRPPIFKPKCNQSWILHSDTWWLNTRAYFDKDRVFAKFNHPTRTSIAKSVRRPRLTLFLTCTSIQCMCLHESRFNCVNEHIARNDCVSRAKHHRRKQRTGVQSCVYDQEYAKCDEALATNTNAYPILFCQFISLILRRYLDEKYIHTNI